MTPADLAPFAAALPAALELINDLVKAGKDPVEQIERIRANLPRDFAAVDAQDAARAAARWGNG